MHEISNPFQALSETFYRPTSVFSTLAHKDNWSWIPFLVVAVLSLLPLYLYFHIVDFNWYAQDLANQMLGDVSPAEKEGFIASMSPGVTSWTTIGSVFIGLLLMNAVMAGYLTFITRNDEKSVHGYTDWYGFIWWTALPTIISSMLALVLLALAESNQVAVTTLSPVSLAYLFSVAPSSDFFNLANSLRLDTIWSICLTAIGIQQWTAFSGKQSWLAATGPFLVIYGVWLIMAVM